MARNQRTASRHSFDGQTHTVAEWANILEITESQIYRRLALGAEFQEIVEKSLAFKKARAATAASPWYNPMVTFRKRTRSLRWWANKLDVYPSQIQHSAEVHGLEGAVEVYYRLWKRNKVWRKAMDTPLNGSSESLADLCERLGLSVADEVIRLEREALPGRVRRQAGGHHGPIPYEGRFTCKTGAYSSVEGKLRGRYPTASGG